jgi:muramoyltetrapeptide carboxypeptidase
VATEKLLVPDALTSGAVVRVVAPAGPFDPRLAWRAMGFLAERYCIRFDRRIFDRCGYLAGSDDDRRAELKLALNEPDVAAIVCARGGYGSSRLVTSIDWTALRRAPRWIVGFSDVTAIHVEVSRQNVASMHASNLTALGRSDDRTRLQWLDALERPRQRRVVRASEGLVPGEATGPLFGGNLTLLHACAAAGRLVVPRGAVLLLEDVGESPYRIDRMLSTLKSGGHLDGVGAIAAGEFDSCRPGPDGVGVSQVLTECLADLGVPIASGLPVGHGRNNVPLVLGARAAIEVRSDGASLTVGDR